MPYGIIKIDTVTFTDAGVDKSVSISGLVQNPTFSGNVTVTGTLSGVTVTGTTANFTSGNFTNISGGTHTITSGVFAAGSAASPSITFTGDLNTGIYSPGADQVAISTGGTGRLFVDASGRILVGTASSSIGGSGSIILQGSAGPGVVRTAFGGTSPGSTDILGAITFTDSSHTGAAYIYGSRDGGTWTSTTSQPSAITFGTTPNGSGTAFERLRITSAGLVGVGTSSPTLKLSVDGDTWFGNGAGVEIGRLFNDVGVLHLRASSNVNGLALGSSGTERLRIDSSGRVGIGTSSPGHLLSVIAPAGSQNIFIAGQSGVSNGCVIESNGSAITHRWYSPTAEAMTLTGGKLGIGTTAPGSFTPGNLVVEAATTAGITISDSTGGGTASIAFSATPSFQNKAKINCTMSSQSLEFSTATQERMRIDSSGRLLVGTSSSPSSGNGQYARFVVQGNTLGPAGYISLQRTQSATLPLTNTSELGYINFGDNAGNSFASIQAFADADTANNDYPGRLVFSTTADGASSPTERMRITSSGAVLANTTSPVSGNSNTFNSADTSVNSWALAGRHTAGSGSGRAILALLPNETANTSVLFLGSTNSLDKFIVWSDGNVVNANNSYGGLSDVKLKENIVDANPQWDDIKALQVRNYNFKEGQTHTQIGLVAQEVELVSPGLVTESPDRDAEGNDLGTVTKSVNYSVLYMKAVKALQEAMERIELLEARLDAANL